MSCEQLSEMGGGGGSRWLTPLACGPGSPQLSKSYSDMASRLLALTFTCTNNSGVPTTVKTPAPRPAA